MSGGLPGTMHAFGENANDPWQLFRSPCALAYHTHSNPKPGWPSVTLDETGFPGAGFFLPMSILG